MSDKTNIAVGSKVITQKLNAEESKQIMNNFKQKALISALAGAGALAMAGAANAVYVNQDGLGQALVYPYYTVRGGNVTLISVVNTTTQGKAVKVRILEGKNSVEVLDFNLFLSPKDVWNASITPTAAGAMLATVDKSCTNPKIPATGAEFRNTVYVADSVNGLDRTREGYVEMLEMATIPIATTLGTAITHVSGVPPCATAQSKVGDAAATVATGLLPPSGGLFGNGTILNVLGGASTGYEATAFDGWSTQRGVITASSSRFPALGSGNVTFSVVNNAGNVYIANWSRSIDAVSATIMHSAVYGEYAYTTDAVIGTDWIVTMPTKNAYVNFSPLTLFQNPWDPTVSRSCDDVGLVGYDREEVTSSTPDDFSPPPPNGRNSLCFEANVVSFGGTSVSGSTNVANINPIQNGGLPVATAGREGGWLELSFTAATALLASSNGTITSVSAAGTPFTTSGAQTYTGLPVIGFVLSSASFKTGNPQQNYSNSYNLRFQRTIN